MSQTAEGQIPSVSDALPSSPSDALWTSDSERIADQPEPAAEPAVETAPAESAPVEVTADRDEAGKFKPKSDKPRDNPYARAKQATQKEAAAKEEARLAREETAALKARLDAIDADRRTPEPAAPVQTPPAAKFPTFDVWAQSNPDADYDDYIDARADARFAARQAQHEAQATLQSYTQELERAKASDPVLVQALQNNPPTSAVMERAILTAPNRIDLVRYLGTHPEDCAQLARDTVNLSLDAVPMMRRYLDSLLTTGAGARPDSASVVTPSSASPPINRVGGTASVPPVDPDDLDFGPDYIRLENAREKKRQEAGRW